MPGKVVNFRVQQRQQTVAGRCVSLCCGHDELETYWSAKDVLRCRGHSYREKSGRIRRSLYLEEA